MHAVYILNETNREVFHSPQSLFNLIWMGRNLKCKLAINHIQQTKLSPYTSLCIRIYSNLWFGSPQIAFLILVLSPGSFLRQAILPEFNILRFTIQSNWRLRYPVSLRFTDNIKHARGYVRNFWVWIDNEFVCGHVISTLVIRPKLWRGH